ncbi:hypothetical protein Ocin01_09393 [Orchesella cincta]|uniref:Uncharacterized protein n=1 Tax=Orchesella cincta TaxID=48709 RepID=A0A1D2MX79_ORCCI|nr:hypothetical protein Ocin01_09393 [Orchesella cincta]
MKFSFGVALCFALVAVALAQRGNFRPFSKYKQPRQQNFDFGLDTSDGRFAKFNGPVKGLPHGHGGGRYGAADCLLCPNGF